MPEPIVIRSERADHPQVALLLEALDRYLGLLYEPQANHILGVEALLAPEVTFLAAGQGERVVGCAALRRMPAEAETDDLPYAEIKRMYVLPEWRGQRIAARLLQTLEDDASNQGLTQALLETGSEQAEAVHLYERCGYRQRGAFGGYPDNGLSVFYAKDLQP
jgi:putative acetyltransferase